MQEIVKKATGKRPSANDKDFDSHQKTANDGFEMLENCDSLCSQNSKA